MANRVSRKVYRVVHYRSYWGWAGSKVLGGRLNQRIRFVFRDQPMPNVAIGPAPPRLSTWPYSDAIMRRAWGNWEGMMTRLFRRRQCIMRTHPWWQPYGLILQSKRTKMIVKAWFPHDELMKRGQW